MAATEASHASWHPALMPHTADGIVASTPKVPTESPAVESFESEKQTIESHPEEPEAKENGLDILDTNEGYAVQDNSNHPELTNLRDALTTSLASPGGVEMEESPQHNGISHEEETIQEQPSDPPQAEFSTGSTYENKHQSTTSFARTVSQEVDLGEDDEVDPEWNLRRTDTDPFKFMAKSDRTNSFPAVPPIHPYGANHFGQEPLAHSQAEDILGEVEAEQNTNDLFSNDRNDGEVDFFSQKAFAPEDSIANNLSNGLDIDSHYEQTFDGNVREGEDEESQVRYEEGLPLVQQQDGQNSAEKLSNSSSFFNESTNDDQEFFAQVSSSPGEDLMPRPEALARKSTMQVMNSMQFQPHESQDDILEEDESEEAANPQSPLDKANGGGLGASKSTILSQVLGDPESSVHEKIQGSETDEDLAAKWKAALDGDEFLDDDDELLDDDEPTNGNPIDPAAFFGSDDEGFLEDTEGQTEPNFLNSQQASPPVPAPMHGVDGKMMGFDSLTGSAHSGQRSVSNRYVPASLAPAPTLQSRSSYAPVAPLLTDLSKPIQSPTLASPYMSPAVSLPGQQQQQARPEVPKAQSFADKNKGGYSSPYDLPMEVVKPRKRVSMNNMGRGYSASPALASVVPPPRSSSRPGQIPSTASVSSLSPPTSSQAMQHPQSDPASNVPQAKSSPSKSKGGFFEELPMAPRPKPTPRSSLGPVSPTMHLPQNNPSQQYSAPPSNNPYSPSIQQSPLQNQLQQQIPQSSLPQGLIAPERVSPYANLPSTANVPLPATTSRYSPAPIQPQSQTASPPVSRYSPAPPPLARQHMPAYASQPVNPQPPPPVLAHQPRTSSPLAHFERSRAPHSAGEPHFDRRSSSSGYEPNMRAHPLPPTREVDENDMSAANQINGGPQMPYAPQAASQPMQVSRQTSQTPPPPQDFASKNLLSPSKRAVSGYIPQQVSNGAFMDFAPPKRSQTQSPGTAYGGPKLEKSNSDPYQRPASVHAPTSPPASSIYTTFTPISSSHPRSFSQSLNYIAPTDGREHDPMQRWKGAPVFAWGVGGTIITSFPKDVPRYVQNQPTPMIIRSPGEVKIRNIKEVDPLDERLSSFPGPLKGKSKKKELLAWLTAGITDLEKKASEKHAYQISSIPHQGHEDKRAEERILLWKILRVFIEHDGILEGNAVVEKAVRAVLSPGLDNENPEDVPMYATGVDLSGVSRSSTSNTMADPVDPAAVDQLKKHLLRGEREKAVWEAVDKRLWAHAMLISNTVSKDLYKQVAQEFVQKEVKSTGENTESLAALYEIFAGNFEESIDELVPPSARAGFKMVSTSNGSGPSKDHLEGLDRWRETLGLVLSNRSLDDNQALNALGKLLAGYGRAEAAHICFLFARSYSVFGGIDDPVSSFVLVGSDHQRQPFEFDKELEPVLLSEVYEYGLSMSATSVIAIPHLAVYKLQHAAILAEYGFRDNALQYCDALASSITSQTKRSPYYHSQLLAALDDLNKRLKQSPKDEKSTWISKPSMDKVSGSVWAKFNKFVAGDENDGTTDGAAAGNGSEAGPFARIAGDTPTISRSPSNSDLYGSYGAGMAMTSMNGGTAIPQTSKTASRYAPGGGYTPTAQEPQMGSSYGSQPRTSFEQRSSSEYRRGPYEPLRQSSDHRPTSQAGSVANSQAPQYGPSYTPQSSYTPYGGGDSPYADAASPYTYQAPGTPNSGRPMPSNVHDSPQSVINDHSPPANTYNRSSSYDPHTSSAYEPPTSGGYEPPTSGYEPPSYEPPSYEPATMNDEPDSPAEPRPKKKGIMDDDDDYPIPRPSGEKTKAEKDREADEAFRRAAEEDAKRAKEEKAAPKKGGWGLGGWFGSKKETTPDMSQPGKPIKAKLGEASSFVYDPELKRWINKKGGADNTPTPSATPPPPRASGPPRTASGPPGMGAAPPSRPGSAASAPVRSTQSLSDVHAPGPPALSGSPLLGPSNLAAPPAMSRSVSNSSVGPPSRPGTSMSNASSIDDLLGPATGGRKGTAKGKKKGRGYIDVMGDKK